MLYLDDPPVDAMIDPVMIARYLSVLVGVLVATTEPPEAMIQPFHIATAAAVVSGI